MRSSLCLVLRGACSVVQAPLADGGADGSRDAAAPAGPRAYVLLANGGGFGSTGAELDALALSSAPHVTRSYDLHEVAAQSLAVSRDKIRIS
jgi:hypothetical protein